MTRPNWLNPITTTIVASLVLSLIAWIGSTVNRDGMLYATAAHAYLDGGFAAAKALFSWPFLPVLMAWTSKLGGIDPESAGYLLNALFMAGTCALMVACVQREKPELAWITCVVVLALPGLNEYRNELLREFGCWCFIMLSFWLALKWHERPTWLLAIAAQASLLIAALFRPEALTFYAALTGWQLFASVDQRWRRLIVISLLPLTGGLILVTLYWSGHLGDGRLAGEFSRLSTDRFDAKADIVATALIEYARGNAKQVLFWGSLALIPIKLIEKFGVFLAPLCFYFTFRKRYNLGVLGLLFLSAIVVYLLVLAVFVTDLQFLAGRYVGPILLFSTPFIAIALKDCGNRWTMLKKPALAVAAIMVLANVISTGPGKAYFAEAATWLVNNAPSTSRVYIDSQRTVYHARWQNSPSLLQPRNDLGAITDAAKSGNFDLLVLERSRKDESITERLKQEYQMTIVARFGTPGKDEVIILRPSGKQ